ncbi:hypothetical protein [Streptomyces sp. NBC_00239]|uniref:hypothetical protein n=1 Tax=Streptomyces sp. NBC_00239 TaxID=2903640 RepID=UPI002E289948|nr:hypothetical protein [Streptomyces sp. NBC_00239]
MSGARYEGAVAALGTSEVARAVGMDPNAWAFTVMQDAPGHMKETVAAVMNTAFEVDAVQRQLLHEVDRAIKELSKTLTGKDTAGHRWTEGLLGDRIDNLTTKRGYLLRQLDTHLAVYRQAAAEPSPSVRPSPAHGPTHPAHAAPQARTPRR